MGNLSFVPKILLCGDEAEFLSRVGSRPFKIVGHVQVSGTVDWGGAYNLNFDKDGKIFFNGEVQEIATLGNFLQNGGADYLLFNELKSYRYFRATASKIGFNLSKVITLRHFRVLPLGFYYEVEAERKIFWHMNTLKIKTLLDIDGYFLNGRLFTKAGNDITEIDVITQEPLTPVMENIYRHAYKNLAQVGFKRYEAVLIVERNPTDFENMLILLENYSDMLITYARSGSDLEKHLAQRKFEKDSIIKTNAGNLHFITRRKSADDFCNYVVTHKKVELDGLPEHYKLIHAGRALNEDIGYIGDDTGDNISYLNPYINEITALYWIWKNTKHDIIGLCHYRRFFTDSKDRNFTYDKILTKDAVLNTLNSYEMIVVQGSFYCTLKEAIIRNVNSEVNVETAMNIMKKHLMIKQPDYLEAFEYVFDSYIYFNKTMFVTRRHVFDAYCSWFFSFFIDATQEILNTIPLDKAKGNSKRLMGFFAEHMHTVWLIKNRLRIKELGIMVASI